MNTFSAKGKDIKRKWWLIDVSKSNVRTLGRIASISAFILRGKHKPDYTPNLDCGDNIVLINADSIELTGKKKDQKLYYRHSGYMGGLKSRTFKEQYELNHRLVVKEAVKGMITRSALRQYIMRKFYVYKGSEHPHMAQNPELMVI